MVELAVTGIAAHSVRPLRFAVWLALAFVALGALLVLYSLVSFLFVQHTVAGWSSIMAAIAILGAAQLLVLGIIGEYVGRILRETRRPAELCGGGDRGGLGCLSGRSCFSLSMILSKTGSRSASSPGRLFQDHAHASALMTLPTFSKISPIWLSLTISGGVTAIESPTMRNMMPSSWKPRSIAS